MNKAFLVIPGSVLLFGVCCYVSTQVGLRTDHGLGQKRLARDDTHLREPVFACRLWDLRRGHALVAAGCGGGDRVGSQ